jgi:nicotinate-nucleotide adenylyltransferase
MTQPLSGELRVAFYGGSFDPPHLGHLAVAHAALAALALDTVLFAPVGAQPLKLSGSSASFEDRAEMTRLALEGEPTFRLSLADAPRPDGEPNYTLESLLAVKHDLPKNCELYCLMGADSFGGFQQWFRAAEIPFLAPLIVASRPGQPLRDLQASLPSGLALEPEGEREQAEPEEERQGIELRRYSLVNDAGRRTPFYLLPDLDIPISATQIRELIGRSAGAEPPAEALEFLPEAVARYIASRGLYR